MSQAAEAFVCDLRSFVETSGAYVHLALHTWRQLGRPVLLRSDLVDAFGALCTDHPDRSLATSPLAALVQTCQEAVVEPSRVWFALRPRMSES